MSITPVAWLLPPGAHCEVRVSLAAAARRASCRPLFGCGLDPSGPGSPPPAPHRFRREETEAQSADRTHGRKCLGLCRRNGSLC